MITCWPNAHSDAYFRQLGYGPAQIAYFVHYPVVPLVFWTISVWASVVGAILLLARSRFAAAAFLLACAGSVVLAVITFGFMQRWQIIGPRLSVQDLLVTGGMAALSYYAHTLTQRRVLR